MKTSLFCCAAALAAAVAAHSALAAPVTISSYDMENGESGCRTFHDDSYGGPGATGNPAVNGSPLAGGLGELTDGILGGNYICNPGANSWVGWINIQPTITFALAAPAQVARLSLWMSNGDSFLSATGVAGSVARWVSTDGLIYTPLGTYLTTALDRTGDGDRWIDIPFPDVMAQFVRIQLFDGVKVGGSNPGLKPFMFVGEAVIAETEVPAPPALGLFAISALCLIAVRRKRSGHVTPKSAQIIAHRDRKADAFW